jgi:ribosomal protein L10
MKKIMSMLLVCGLITASAVPVDAQALFMSGENPINDNVTEIDDAGFFKLYEHNNNFHSNYQVFRSESDKKMYYVLNCYDDRLDFVTGLDCDSASVSALVNEFFPNAKCSVSESNYSDGAVSGKGYVFSISDSTRTGAEVAASARLLCKALKDAEIDVKEFTYYGAMYDVNSYCVYDTAYVYSDENSAAVYDLLADSQSVAAVDEDNSVRLVSEDNTALFDVMKQLNEEGISSIKGSVLLLASNISSGSIIDVLGAVPGDVNVSGNATISDIVSVLQFSANSKKYPLSTQAQFNADMNGDGSITSSDAYDIQVLISQQ